MGRRMTDAQFGRWYELLKLCEQKAVPLRFMHRLAEAVWEEDISEEAMQSLMRAVKLEKFPFTKGIPAKITLCSDGISYDSDTEKPVEMMQKLTVQRNGRISICNYDGTGALQKREYRRIPERDSSELLEEIHDCFAMYFSEDAVTDVNTWHLKITNQEHQSFSFSGAFDDAEDFLVDLSCILRELLEYPALLCFDGRNGGYLQFVGVVFPYGYHTYTYLGNGAPLQIGDTVEVTVGRNSTPSVATVVNITYGPAEDAPYPLEKMKTILRVLPPKL